jgi:hypothetical protein
MTGKPQISVSAATAARIDDAAERAGIPKATLVEIITARAIGIPDAQLPEHVRAWLPKFAAAFPSTKR